MTDGIFSENNLLLPRWRQLLLASLLTALQIGLLAERAEAIKWTGWRLA